MTTLDRVAQLQNQGMQDSDIIRILREENVSPLEINDALNQAKVKSAVSGDISGGGMEQFTGMEQSIMNQDQGQMMAQPEEQGYAPQQDYNQGYGYSQPQNLDTGTMTEIAEQVVMEKFEEFYERIGDIGLFKSEVQDKIKDLDERIKRIESSLDKIQQSIIGKIGEYGESMGTIKKDLGNLHETVSKLMNPLVDNYMELKKLNQQR